MGADADALRRGADPSALASALLKADPSFSLGTSFATASTQRLRPSSPSGRAPSLSTTHDSYEWLPAAAVVVGAPRMPTDGPVALRDLRSPRPRRPDEAHA